MNKLILPAALISTMMFLTSCEAIGTIFKGGMWTGIILVVLVLALVGWLLGRRK